MLRDVSRTPQFSGCTGDINHKATIKTVVELVGFNECERMCRHANACMLAFMCVLESAGVNVLYIYICMCVYLCTACFSI